MSGTTGPQPPFDEAERQAWIDDRLPPGRRAEIDAWLAAHPEEAALLRAMAAEREALRSALRPRFDQEVPSALRVATLLATQRRTRRWRAASIAAALCGLALGGALGWSARGLRPEAPPAPVAQQTLRPMVREAMAAHHVFAADLRRPVEIGATEEAQLVRWLSNRLGRPLRPPELGALGYSLIGGRLLPGAAGQPAAQLMYENADGQRLSVYLRIDEGGALGTEFRFAGDARQGVSAFWWVDQGFGYAVAAEGIDRNQLLRLAEFVHRQTSEPTPSARGL